jgi:hypothetical protein
VRTDRTRGLHRSLGAGHDPPARLPVAHEAHQRSRGSRRRQPRGHDGGFLALGTATVGPAAALEERLGGKATSRRDQPASAPRWSGHRRGDGRGGTVPARPHVNHPEAGQAPGHGIDDVHDAASVVGRSPRPWGCSRVGGPAPARTGLEDLARPTMVAAAAGSGLSPGSRAGESRGRATDWQRAGVTIPLLLMARWRSVCCGPATGSSGRRVDEARGCVRRRRRSPSINASTESYLISSRRRSQNSIEMGLPRSSSPLEVEQERLDVTLHAERGAGADASIAAVPEPVDLGHAGVDPRTGKQQPGPRRAGSRWDGPAPCRAVPRG